MFFVCFLMFCCLGSAGTVEATPVIANVMSLASPPMGKPNVSDGPAQQSTKKTQVFMYCMCNAWQRKTCYSHFQPVVSVDSHFSIVFTGTVSNFQSKNSGHVSWTCFSSSDHVFGDSWLQESLAFCHLSVLQISIQTETVKPCPPSGPKILKNKALLCRPLVQNKGVSCKTQTADVEAQTGKSTTQTRCSTPFCSVLLKNSWI